MSFMWWDDAVGHAHQLAADTRIRHRVFAGPGGIWVVDLARDAVLEPCS